MSSVIHIEMASELDENTAETLYGESAAVAQYATTSKRTLAGRAALRAPSEPLEHIWAALEDLHRDLHRAAG